MGEEKVCPRCKEGKLVEKTIDKNLNQRISLGIAVFGGVPIPFGPRIVEKYYQCSKCEYKENKQ